MKHLKNYEQFNTNQFRGYIEEVDENFEIVSEGLFGKSDEQRKEEIKKLLEPIKAETLKSFVNNSLEKSKIAPDRLLNILKRVFFSTQGWAKNPNKYNLFATVAKDALEKDNEESWNKAISLLDFGMKGSTSSIPYWNEEKKQWLDKSKAGTYGL